MKADENFRQLHHSLIEIEDHLQMARTLLQWDGAG